jgi:hypothetical protein
MVRAITLLLLISLHSLTYADNTVTVQTKGSGSSISVQQVGSGNVTGVYCGLGSFDSSLINTHNCDNATISVSLDGSSNVAYAQSVWSNHDSQVWSITVDGDDNYAVIDMDQDDNSSTIIQTGNDNDALILGTGNNNVYKIEQTGNDMYAKFMTFADNSDIWSTQEGSGNHNVYVYNANGADNNSTRVIQKGSGNKDADVFWYADADNGQLNLTQQGNGAHTSNIKFYTDDYNVNVIQKGATNQAYSVTFNCVSNCTKTISITQE